MNKTTQAERFKYMRENIINLSQAKLAERLEDNTPNIINIENGRTKRLDSLLLEKLSSEYLINIEWLLFGKGNPTKVDDDEDAFHKYGNSNIVGIPFYEVKAAAGQGEMTIDNPDKEVIWFDKRWLKNVLGVNPDNLSIIQAKGDSMDGGNNPIKDGDLLMVDCSVKEGNNVFVIKDDNELRVKKLKWNFDGTLDIISNNPKYSVETLDENTGYFRNIEIIGKVVWNGSKENV